MLKFHFVKIMYLIVLVFIKIRLIIPIQAQ